MQRHALMAAMMAAVLLAACGGGGGSAVPTNPPVDTTPSTTSHMASAPVRSPGHQACTATGVNPRHLESIEAL